MPYPSNHHDDVKERVIKSAQRLFNRHGFNAVSIDGIMADAGLTRGTFYSYFDSKSELYAEAVSRIARDKTQLPEGADLIDASELASQIVREYLSRRHLEDIDGGCPMIGLPNDISHTNARVKQAFATALRVMVQTLERGLGADDARHRALAISALCVGGMVLARSIDDDVLGDEVRQAAMTAAMMLGQWG
jgi:TetR/AcrR family transcriptional regulator, transcriptional repressor for nem operon